MFERERTLYAFTTNYAKKVLADIPDEQMRRRQAPGLNPPLWILGHLTICTDYGLQLLGRPTRLPGPWLKMFGPGSDPDALPADAPGKAQLLSAFAAGSEAVAQATKDPPPEVLGRPHGIDIGDIKTAIPTVGDLVAHLMTTHQAFHLGQLSACRRLLGMPPLF